MDYLEFLETKKKNFISSGFDVNKNVLNHKSILEEKNSTLTLF